MDSGSRDFQVSNRGRDSNFVNYRSREGSETSAFRLVIALKSSGEIGPGSTAFA